ncbi:Dual specificity tyrosine-phosphorylation-regulated kinase [Nowakowskiella sp. JEL0078]|nr:Dual specificity tyrosine-phosphorylation-regulated kinase [Nowakowskiella sp. JEL0078]
MDNHAPQNSKDLNFLGIDGLSGEPILHMAPAAEKEATERNKNSINNFGDMDISTFGRVSPQSHLHSSQPLYNNSSQFNNSQSSNQTVSLFAELSAAAGVGNLPIGTEYSSNRRLSNGKSSISQTIISTSGTSVQIDNQAGRRASIANTTSPLDIFGNKSQYRQPDQENTTQPSNSNRSSIYSTASTNSKYIIDINGNRRASTATVNTMVGSPITASSAKSANLTLSISRSGLSPNSATSPNTAVNASQSRSSFSSSTSGFIVDRTSSSRNSIGNSATQKTRPSISSVSSNVTTPTANISASTANRRQIASPSSVNNSTSTTPNASTKTQRPTSTTTTPHFKQQSTGTGGKEKSPINTENVKSSTNSSTTRNSTSRPNKLPLSPDACIFGYKDLLTIYEQREIFDYPEIYYLGAPGVNKVGMSGRRSGGADRNMDNKDAEIYNDGYDDSRGDYYLTTRDHVGYRYEIVALLGKGSFGQVAKCFDHKDKRHVALKIIRNKKRFEKQGVVEVKVLDRVRKEDTENKYHSVHMLDHFYFRGHLCITFEMLGINLYDWLKAGGFRGVHLGVIRVFTIQILKCLELMQKNKIIHCDLKPENVLLCDVSVTQPSYRDSNQHNSYSRSGSDYGKSSPTPNYYGPAGFDSTSSQYEIKVIDFGSSCFEHEKVYTYVQSRFYRSPEVILGTYNPQKYVLND